MGEGSFDMYADVPNHAGVGHVCGTPEHEPEMFNWFITSAGSFQTLQVGTVQSSSDVEAAFDWIKVHSNPVEAPVVISQIQTHTGGGSRHAISPYHRMVFKSGWRRTGRTLPTTKRRSAG